MKSTNSFCASVGALFDLDGVLIDTETEYTRIWGEIDRRFPSGIDNFPLVIKGTTLPHILSTYYPENLRDEVVDMLRRSEAEIEYRPIEGAFEFLEALAEAGIPAAVVTSSNDEKMATLYRQLPDFPGRFATIVTACDISRSKPDPEGYMLAARRLGLPSERCCVFEDSFQGLEAGRRAGGRVVALATTNPRHTLNDLADLIIDDFRTFRVDNLLELMA